MRPLLRTWLARLLEERLFLILLLSLPLLLWGSPLSWQERFDLIEWTTLSALTGLLLLSRGLEFSGYITLLARKLISRLTTQRQLACLLILLAAFLSAIITNDVALFITLPLTLVLARLTPLPLARLAIFQALAVNAGSSISPFGNPQNLFIWQKSGISFIEFLQMMLPLSSGLFLVVLLLIPLAFRNQPLEHLQQLETTNKYPRLFWLSLLLYAPFLLLAEAGWALPAGGLLIGIFLIFYPRLLLGLDWLLLLIFLLMFLNLGLLASLPSLQNLGEQLDQWPGGIFTAGVVFSQFLSNVPATLFLYNFTDNWQALAWGVNVGGFGLALGSLANLIALRLVKIPGIWKEFHLWSFTTLFLSLLFIGLMLL